MLKRERQAYIVHQVNLHNKVLSATLSSEIAVSEDTIRRDLQELSDTGKLIKVHGGALSHSFDATSFPSSRIYAQTKKRIIAQKAASLIKDGMFVLTGGGTTIIELARVLPHHLHATFISGSIPAIVEYMHHPNIEVIVLGDKLSKTSKITIGADAIARIKNIKADLCILGINAIELENGITDNDWDVVQLKQQMIASAKKTICLSIAEKINSVQPIHVCDALKIDTLVTELDPEDPLLAPYAAAGIHII
jgi:DeoR/GlpR family transcriptional regulator of sugar metabolism